MAATITVLPASITTEPIIRDVADITLSPDHDDEGHRWAYKILLRWQQTVEGIVEVGELLIQAKDALPFGAFEKMVHDTLPFSGRAARMLMAIARHPVLSERNHGSVLPASWRTLYELSKLDERELNAALRHHMVKVGITRDDVQGIRKRVRQLLSGRRAPARRAAPQAAATKPTGYDRLVKAWANASSTDRERFLEHIHEARA